MFDVIHSYTRAQAIDDGVLVEVPQQVSQEAGFKIPVAMTARVWSECVGWTDEDEARQCAGQDEQGRLWDLLAAAKWAAMGEPEASVVLVRLSRVPRNPGPHQIELQMSIGGGDEGEPVITLLFEGEA